MRSAVPRFAVLIIVLIMLVIVMVPMAASADFVLPRTDLQLAYVHELRNGDNQTCLTASWDIARIQKTPLQVDILFAPDFEKFGKWGLGASTVLAGISSNLKLGLGLMGGIRDPVAYVSFRLN
jgi:hypothetical protein